MTTHQIRLLELVAEALLDQNEMNEEDHKELYRVLKHVKRERRIEHRESAVPE